MSTSSSKPNSCDTHASRPSTSSFCSRYHRLPGALPPNGPSSIRDMLRPFIPKLTKPDTRSILSPRDGQGQQKGHVDDDGIVASWIYRESRSDKTGRVPVAIGNQIGSSKVGDDGIEEIQGRSHGESRHGRGRNRQVSHPGLRLYQERVELWGISKFRDVALRLIKWDSKDVQKERELVLVVDSDAAWRYVNSAIAELKRNALLRWLRRKVQSLVAIHTSEA